MCFKLKVKEDPDGEFAAHVAPRPVSGRGHSSSPLPSHIARRSLQPVIVEERSPHASGQLRRTISVSERSPHASTQLVRPASTSGRSPRTSRNRLSASRLVVVEQHQAHSPRSSGRLSQPAYVEIPPPDPPSIPLHQQDPLFVQTREPPAPASPGQPTSPPPHRASRSNSTHGDRQRSRSRAYSAAPQPSPRSSAVNMERQASGGGSRPRGESQSRHERRSSREQSRSKYADDARRLSREPSQSGRRDSQLYLEDGRRQDGNRMVEERIIHGEGRTTKQYYYV